MSKFTASFGHPAWVLQREINQRLPLGHSDTFCKRLYSSIREIDNSYNSNLGAVISLDFSPDASLLVAGSIKNSILIYDTLRRKQIGALITPQMGCLFTIKFLDNWTFASGSEDRSVTLWDTRNLKKWARRLVGHSSSVRNIEFSSKNDVLVTTGDDGTVLVWNLKNTTEGVTTYSKFGSDDFWGIRLNPDASKMIISSTGGYLIIVHDLDLNTVAADLAGFYPGIGPVWDLEEFPPSASLPRENVFSRSRKRNRAEAVLDFPHLDVFHNVSALEIHPQGCSALSLCMSIEKKMEWVCVHDIRDKELPACGDASPEGSGSDSSPHASREMHSNEKGHEYIPRLTHYFQKHASISDICIFKELSFSPDGRLICYPSGNDIKLHIFSPRCSEQFMSWPGGEPIPLHEIATFNCDTFVYSTRFSPRHCLLVAGSEGDSINWYQPVL
ncbi:DDB1- and CUL4-associated factor 10 homolog [Gryllus bimaculatus]|nr:DDB1- and CUL4-associated factor 10 homolog [Gryllus bimaculatus]